MKTLKLISCIVLICAFGSFAQTPTPAPAPEKPATIKPVGQESMSHQSGMTPVPAGQQPVKMNRYMVQLPHTKADCQGVKDQLMTKGAPIMMRFDWGCASGDHTGYAILPGANEDGLRKQLPEGLQKTAKVTKVDKYTATTTAQPDQMQK